MTDYTADFRQARAAMPAETYEACDALRKSLDGTMSHLKDETSPLPDAALDALADIASLTEHSDIHDPDAEIHHQQTPQSTVSQHALRFFVRIAHGTPDNAPGAVGRLEAIARDNLDFDLRQEATMALYSLTRWEGPAKELALTALERQGRENDCSYIRTLARDNILSAADQSPDIAPRAWAAQIAGAEDPDPEARTRALALLTNRVKKPDCGYEEAESLMNLFRAAAAKAGTEEEAVKYWADRGVVDLQSRRLQEMVDSGCATTQEVKPLKPFAFRK